MKKRKKGRPLLIIISVVLLIVLAIGALVLKEMAGSSNGGPVLVQVEKGSGSVTIADELKENGVIGNTFIFRMYVKMTGSTAELQYGRFELTEKMPYKEIVEALKQKNTQRETVTVTFPEGFSLVQFAQRMEREGLCSEEEFIEVANNGDFSEFAFFTQVSDNPDKFMKMEGYLFPDTYEFFADESVESMVRKIYANFDAKMAEFYPRMDELGLSLENTLNIASFVQEEAGNPINMSDVAAVLHNRLAPGSPSPLLECDATWYYIYDFIEPYYGGAANTPQALYDAYDSYSIVGLPAGPISNPGIDAIRATLYPTENSPYYFFVTDLTGHYYYAVTFEAHLVNVAEAKRVDATLN